MALQRSILHPLASAEGSTFLEHYGWELPAAFRDAEAEYRSATTAAAVYDASYMGRLKATGEDTLDLLNRLSTNKVVDLTSGQGTPTILTTDRGRILDVVIVVHVGDHILLLTSPETQNAVIEWLDKYTIMEDMAVEDVSSATCMIALWGPDAAVSLERATGGPLAALPRYHNQPVDLGGSEVQVVSCPMSDIPGFYLLGPVDSAPTIWQSLVEAGAEPIGAHAHETARIRAGVPSHGPELGEDYNPLEAGLIGSIDFTKGCYIGQEVIARLDSYHKVQKYLVRLAFEEGAVVSPGAFLLEDGKRVGKVTSVAPLPVDEQRVGLAYVRTAQATAGRVLEMEAPAEGSARVLGLPQMFGPEQEA
jgi:folate-binding protein YgfZ